MKPMKLNVSLLAIGTSLCLLTTNAYPQNGNTCPPPGTEVPFAKVINEAFASDYVGCDITVKVEFLTSSASPYHWDYVKGTSGKVPFQVVVPGEQPSSGPLGPAPQPHVFLSKDRADVIFSMKKGDLIILRGALAPKAKTPRIGMMPGLTIEGWPQVFIASDLLPANASDAAIKQMTQSKTVAAPAIPPPAGSEAVGGIPEIPVGMVYGVHLKTPDGTWTTLNMLMPSGQESRGLVSKGFVTYRGAESPVHISDRRPVFFVQSGSALDARGWHIQQLGKKGDHRESQVSQETAFGGKSGESVSDKEIREVVVKKVTDYVSSLTPAADLGDGEYVVTDGLFKYDFGIGK
jgi:hypothetical protein